MKRIVLSSGMVALVDGDDYERVSQFKWSYHALGYAFRSYGPKKDRRNQYLHRFILGEPPHAGHRMVVDHVNGNKLDNRKENLRVVSKSANSINSLRAYGHNKTSGVRGVYWSNYRRAWIASFTHDGKKHTRHFARQEDAAEYITRYRSKIHASLMQKQASSPPPISDSGL